KPVDGALSSNASPIRLPNQAAKSGCQILGLPTISAGSNRRVGHVLWLALVAHRRRNRGDTNLTIAAIEALHFGLDLGWGFAKQWHLASLGDRTKQRWTNGWRTQDRHEKSWGIMSCGDIRRPSTAVTLTPRFSKEA